MATHAFYVLKQTSNKKREYTADILFYLNLLRSYEVFWLHMNLSTVFIYKIVISSHIKLNLMKAYLI